MTTLQQIYDQTVTFLRHQGEAAVHRNPKAFCERCLYRTKQGLKCAVGCHIPDDKYTPEMEQAKVHYINTQYNLGFTAEQVELLVVLQKAHDSQLTHHGLVAWEERMQMIAGNYGLNYTEPTV